MNEFTDRATLFTMRLRWAANWKTNFFGAAYSTRLRAAIKHARLACDELEKFLDEEKAR